MEKIIRKKSKDLLKKLPAEKSYYQSKDFIQAGFPAYLSKRINSIIIRRMQLSLPMPESDWVNTESEKLQNAWQFYTEAMKEEIKLPVDSAAEVIEKAIENCLKLAVQPRRAVPELLFNTDDELSLDELKSRTESISVNSHLAYALVRYMEKKNKQLMSFETAKSVIEKIDAKLVSDFNPLNWVEILKPLFSLAGPSVDSDLFRIFFEEKGEYKIAKKFDLLNDAVNEMEFIEIMSSGEFLDIDSQEKGQPGFFELSYQEEIKSTSDEISKVEKNRNHLIEITEDDEEEEPEEDDLNSLFNSEEEEKERTDEAPFDLDDDTPVRNQKTEMGVDDFDDAREPERDESEIDEEEEDLNSFFKSEEEEIERTDEAPYDVDDDTPVKNQKAEMGVDDFDDTEVDRDIESKKIIELDEDEGDEDLNSYFKTEDESLIDNEPEENTSFDFTREENDDDYDDEKNNKPFLKRTSETETEEDLKETQQFVEQEIKDEEFEKLFEPEEDAKRELEKPDLFNVRQDTESLLSVYKPESTDESEDEEDVFNKDESDEEVPLVNRFRFDDSAYEDEEEDEDEDEDEGPATIYSELNLIKDNRDEPSVRSLFEQYPETEDEIEQSAEAEKEVDNKAEYGKSGIEKYPTKYIETSEQEEEVDEDENTGEELPMWRSFLERDDVETDSGFQFDDSEDEVDEDGFIEEPIFDITKDSGVNKKFNHINDWLKDEKKVFIKKLFGDSDAAYEQALADIVEYDDWKKASKFIEKEIFSRNRIDMYDETAIDFTDRLHSYFLDFKS